MNLVSLEEVKRHLRITNDEDDDYLENTIIPAATLKVIHFIWDPSISFTIETCPADIKNIILIECGDRYDMERNSYQPTSIKKTDLFERSLMFYKKMWW